MKNVFKILFAFVCLITALGLLLFGLAISMIFLGFRVFDGWLGFIMGLLVVFPFLILFALFIALFIALFDFWMDRWL